MDTRKEEREVLYSLATEVDKMFFTLRKKYQIICRELKLIKRQESEEINFNFLPYLSESDFKTIVTRIPDKVIDNHVEYMLRNENNNIFKLMKQYNEYLDLRNQHKEKNSRLELMEVDEKLADCLQNLGAMIYHLHIQLHGHLNLLNILARNEALDTESYDVVVRESMDKKNINEYCITPWGQWTHNSSF